MKCRHCGENAVKIYLIRGIAYFNEYYVGIEKYCEYHIGILQNFIFYKYVEIAKELTEEEAQKYIIIQ